MHDKERNKEKKRFINRAMKKNYCFIVVNKGSGVD